MLAWIYATGETKCDLEHYIGNVSITDGGRKCQRWSKQVPRSHYYDTDAYFPLDESIEAAENYCRPVEDTIPWCFTMDPKFMLQSCGARICGGL